MVDTIMLHIDGNFYATKFFDWLYEKGFGLWEKGAPDDENRYITLRNNLVVLYNVDQNKIIDEMREAVGNGIFNPRSIKRIKPMSYKSADEIFNLYENALRNATSFAEREILDQLISKDKEDLI